MNIAGGDNPDYSTVTMTITFPAGERQVTIPVNTVNDDIYEPLEVLGTSLSNPTNGLFFGIQDTATVTIVDNDGNISG